MISITQKASFFKRIIKFDIRKSLLPLKLKIHSLPPVFLRCYSVALLENLDEIRRGGKSCAEGYLGDIVIIAKKKLLCDGKSVIYNV